MKVIFHGDDLGITAGASRTILAAWAAGGLDGFSIIANGDALDAVREGLLLHRNLPARIGVHVNLTEGRASESPDRVPGLVGSDGMFRHDFGGYFRQWMFSSQASWASILDQVEVECRAQIRAVRAVCGSRPLAVIDGHNHVHMIPGIFSAVARAAAAEGIPEIRVSREPLHLAGGLDWLKPFWLVNLLKHVLLRGMSAKAAPVATAAGLAFPEYLIGVLYTGRMTAERATRGISAARGARRIEVLFHVGQSTPDEAARWQNDGYASFHVSPRRSAEYAELLRLRAEWKTP